MWSPAVNLEKRAPQVAALWGLVLTLGVVALLAVGNLEAVAAVRDSVWAVAYRTQLRWVTDYGMYPFYIFFLGLLAYGWKCKQADLANIGAAYLLAQLIGAVLIVRTLKVLIAQPRPDAGELLQAQGWNGPSWDSALHSFPSGHTADLFTSAVFLAVLLPHAWLRLLCLAFACLVGFTRIALAKHYPVDVLGGAFIGGATALAVIYLWLLPRLKRASKDGAEVAVK